MYRILTAAILVLAVASTAGAQTGGVTTDRPDTEGGRYVLRRMDDGLMRMDRETGAISYCRKRAESWVCEAVADDREAMEAEITRLVEDNAELAREIGRLKNRIARLEGRGEKPRTDGQSPESDVPSDEEIDRVMETFEKFMRRFMDMAQELRKEYEQQDRF